MVWLFPRRQSRAPVQSAEVPPEADVGRAGVAGVRQPAAGALGPARELGRARQLEGDARRAAHALRRGLRQPLLR